MTPQEREAVRRGDQFRVPVKDTTAKVPTADTTTHTSEKDMTNSGKTTSTPTVNAPEATPKKTTTTEAPSKEPLKQTQTQDPKETQKQAENDAAKKYALECSLFEVVLIFFSGQKPAQPPADDKQDEEPAEPDCSMPYEMTL